MESNHLTALELTKISRVLKRTLSKWLLSTDRCGASTTLLGQPVSASDHLHGIEVFFHAQSDPPWCRSVPFHCVLPPVPGSRDQHLPWCFPPQGSAGSSEAASQPAKLLSSHTFPCLGLFGITPSQVQHLAFSSVELHVLKDCPMSLCKASQTSRKSTAPPSLVSSVNLLM